MKDLAKKVAVGIATSALVAQSFVLPALADITVEVKGNGADSSNTTNISSATTTTVTQSNTANVSNNVDASADTGENDANYNTGGDVSVETGNAQSKAEVSNTLNSNEAHVDCGGCPQDVSAEISGNGYNSDNDINLDVDSTKWVTQSNTAHVENDVNVDADTGENDANYNTGGDVSVSTGWAKALAEVDTKANANVARVGSGDDGGALELLIHENGANSDNTINASLSNTVGVVQDNWADIENDVEVDADTGENDANDNTGGDVSVETGNAFAGAAVDTQANFNFANVECCGLDGFIKVAGNGYNADNDVNLALDSTLYATQDNWYTCGGHRIWDELLSLDGKRKHGNCDVNADADTGENDANRNTGWGDGDPVEVSTGNASTDVEVDNKANTNVFSTGDALPDWPDWQSDGSFSGWLWLLTGHLSG